MVPANTATGSNALGSLTSGSGNTAMGDVTLLCNSLRAVRVAGQESQTENTAQSTTDQGVRHDALHRE
jgi:hypothetical protein